MLTIIVVGFSSYFISVLEHSYLLLVIIMHMYKSWCCLLMRDLYDKICFHVHKWFFSLKFLGVLFGAVCIAMAAVASLMGSILQVKHAVNLFYILTHHVCLKKAAFIWLCIKQEVFICTIAVVSVRGFSDSDPRVPLVCIFLFSLHTW